jgi:hypothetical protein
MTGKDDICKTNRGLKEHKNEIQKSTADSGATQGGHMIE